MDERLLQKKRAGFSVIDRGGESEEIWDGEGASMPWNVTEAIRTAEGRVPDLFYEIGAIVKKPVTVLVGNDPIWVVREMIRTTGEYRRGSRSEDRQDRPGDIRIGH